MTNLEAYESGVLRPDVHDRLVADLDRICRTAGVPKYLVWTALATNCNEVEVDYVTRYRQHTQQGNHIGGLCYVGMGSPLVRMQAVAAALLRNFIDARVMTLQEAIEQANKGQLTASCLLIPNFHGGDGGKLPAWQLQLLNSLIIERFTAGLQTCLCVSDMGKMSSDYGNLLASHIKTQFITVEV